MPSFYLDIQNFRKWYNIIKQKGLCFMKHTFNFEDMPELKGQVVDIFEDYLTDKEISIPNEDRDDAIADGEDTEDLAIIYGADYDAIADEVEFVVNTRAKTNDVSIVPFSEEQFSELIDIIIQAFMNLIPAAYKDEVSADIPQFKKKLKVLFVNWQLC